MFNEYPYRNLTDLNLDYILNAIKTFQNDVTNFVSINAIKYANPIQWDITRQYEKNTIVIDPVSGTAYISVAPVPSGVALTREEYWTVVFDLGMFVVRAAKNYTERYEAETTTTATFSTPAGGWLVWGDTLYVANVNITAGDSYVVDSNITHITMEEMKNAVYQLISNNYDAITDMIGSLDDLDTTDKSNLVAAINEVLTTLLNTSGDLADLDTTEKANLVAAINEVLTTTNTKIDNLKIVNVLDYGAIGDGVTDDTSAIGDAIATGKLVYFPRGNYLVSSMTGFSHDNFIGGGEIIINSHNYPVGKAASVNAYESDFATLSDLISWVNKSKYESANVYIDTAAVVIGANDFVDFLRAGNILHLYPTTIEKLTVSDGIVYLHNPIWTTVNGVFHLLVNNGATCHIVGTDTVHAKSNNFHFWVRENAKLFLNNVVSDVDSNCAFQFFIYAETGAVVTAEGYTWTGTTGACWGASFTQGAVGEFNVNSWRDFITFFPTSFSTSPNVNSRDYMLPFCNVGSVVGSIPDYGWKPFFGESGYDMSGQTFIEADDIPDIYTMLAITGTDIKSTGSIHIQVRRMFENSWDDNVGDYEGIDIQIPTTPYNIPVAGETITGGVVNVGGVDYPLTGATVGGGSISMDALTFRTNNSVSACYSGAGNNTIEFQICFIQYQGLDRPQYIGYISDGAGTKHYFNGVLKNYGRIASARVIFTDVCTQGNCNILLNA